MTGKNFYSWYHNAFLPNLKNFCKTDDEFIQKVEQCRTLISINSVDPSDMPYDNLKMAFEYWLKSNCPYIFDLIEWDEYNNTMCLKTEF